MNPYSQTLAQARLDALQALQQALQDAETPDEKRRCAVAIFNAPDPCDLDDSLEWPDDDTEANDQHHATVSPALRGQHVQACNGEIASSDARPHQSAPEQSVRPAADASPVAGACCNLDTRIAAASVPSPDPLFTAMCHLNSLLDAAGVPDVSDEAAEAYLHSLGPATTQ